MKKLLVFAIVAVALTIFNGCQKDEQVLIDVQPQAAVKPDVYAENGYLVFKNLNTLDSLVNILGNKDLDNRKAWEESIGFKSAKTYYEKFFIENEKINSLEELISFRKRNKYVLKWNEDDSDDFSFDYPFYKTGLVSVMNKEGIFKIGRSIVKYTKNKKVIIIDGDIQQIETAINQNVSTGNILVYTDNTLLKSSGSSTHHTISYFTEDYGSAAMGSYIRWSKKRRMQNKLAYEAFTYTLNNGLWEGGYQVYFRQKAQKRVWGVWVNYYTKYKIIGLNYSNLSNSYSYQLPYQLTGETNQNYVYIEREITYTNQPNEQAVSRPSPLIFSCSSTCRGFGYYPISIDYAD